MLSFANKVPFYFSLAVHSSMLEFRVVFLVQINLYITRSCLFSFPILSFFCCINNGSASKQMNPDVGGFLLSTPLYSHTWLMVGLFSPALLCSLNLHVMR